VNNIYLLSKVSGIPSGNKLIKRIYSNILTCEDIISSHVKIPYLITFLFCPFNYTKICWCMIETSSDLLRSSLAIFGNLRKCSKNVRKRSPAFGTILENLRKSSENRQKRRHQDVYRDVCIIKRTLHVSSNENIKFISSRHRVRSSSFFPSKPKMQVVTSDVIRCVTFHRATSRRCISYKVNTS